MIKTFDKMDAVADFLEKEISCKPKDVLCCFDIDDTIVVIDHPAALSINYKKYKSHFDIMKSKFPDFELACLPLICENKTILFDDTFCESFNKMPYRKIALTAAMTGEFDTIKRIEVFRYERLKEHNIIFDDPLFADKDIILDNLPSYMGYYPVCYKGVLCSNGENTTTNKGSALCGLLKKINFTPEYVIQIDDKQLNLDFINEELSKQFPNIKFIGILYTGAENYCPEWNCEISEEVFVRYWEKFYHKGYSDRNKYVKDL